MAEPTALIGRDRELGRLLAALTGDGRLLLITGDAGVGKSRVAAEGMARAAAAGVVAARGDCLPLAGALPLLPVAAALGELAEADDGALLAAALAERTRLAGSSDSDSWRRAAKAWQEAGCPHRAGYAWWQAEAELNRGQRALAADALRAAAVAADGHVPLLARVPVLAKRAHVSLQPTVLAQQSVPGQPSPAARGPYRLTSRELAALRLLADGHTNAEIAAALYISPSTAGVHVTSILRKLGVSGRVQAAALAERAGLLDEQQPG